ncbi:MAG TPA: DUF1622 domain-containing protein [Devosiaceae bacterium]|jgi:uncharacterized membrane protein
MREWFVIATENAILIIDMMALVVVVLATIEAFWRGLAVLFRPSASNHDRREVWLRYARWLVAGLTFQLAADIIETSITSDREALFRIAVVALVRTFLNYFLERDVAEVRGRQRPATTDEA